MKAVMVMFDSLNRRMLPNYGCDWVHAPHFESLSERCVTFDNCYSGSLPCMPARRELHTGRYNFLHRSWGPLEPFDDSMIDILKQNGIYTHLTTDHMHYLEDGGATYHTRYNSWDVARGQEGDHWKGSVADPEIPETVSQRTGDVWRQDWINRRFIDAEEKHPHTLTFDHGLEFIERNRDQDNWFLQIESFDPHEPFFTQQSYKDLYPHEYEGRHFDWPDYYKVTEESEEVQHAIYEYAALLSMCDHSLGKVLDVFDHYDLWKDTMLIVNTDHGFMLGEKEWWGKNIQPFYNEIVHIPLFIWDPRYQVKNERSDALVQTIDLAPTLLDYFGIENSADMQGEPLGPVIKSKVKVRKTALFGIHGGHVNCTDGRYVYMRAPIHLNNNPLYEYTLLPTHMNHMFDVAELSNIELTEPFDFTKSCRLMKIQANTFSNAYLQGNMLFDLETDPEQKINLDSPEVEAKMIKLMTDSMRSNDAPQEQYERLGIPVNGNVAVEELKKQKDLKMIQDTMDLGLNERWEGKSQVTFLALVGMLPNQRKSTVRNEFKKYLQQYGIQSVTADTVVGFVEKTMGDGTENIVRFIKLFMI